jgi:RNA 3'-terminal phosphate cyclase (ATP)
MAQDCDQRLAQVGLAATVDRIDGPATLDAGASPAVWGETSSGCILGADRAGALRRISEAIGRFVAERFLADVATGSTVGRHLALETLIRGKLVAVKPNDTWASVEDTSTMTQQ